MKHTSVVLAAFLGLGATLATASAAGAHPQFRGHGVVTPRFHARGAAAGHFGGGRAFPHAHAFPHHGFGHNQFFFPHRFAPFAVVAPPVFVYSSPSIFDSPYYGAALDPPTPAYSAPAYSAPVYSVPAYAPPAPAPMPRVVEFSTGRYELRGDGVTSPYTWVWIPNPPTAPPGVPPPPPAAAPGPPASGRAPSDATPVRRTEVYRWTDAQGVVHLTDRLDAVPPQHRREAKSPTIF